MAAEAQQETAPGALDRFRSFWDGLRTELRQVIWPTWEQVWQTGIVVIVAVIFFGGYLFLADNVMHKLVTDTLERFFKGLMGS